MALSVLTSTSLLLAGRAFSVSHLQVATCHKLTKLSWHHASLSRGSAEKSKERENGNVDPPSDSDVSDSDGYV